MKKIHLLLLVIILLSGLVRLYRWDRPLADWHSWRQVDTAAVTRRYVNEGINLLYPKYDDLSNIPSGKDNPQGYRMVEFPFNNALIAFLYTATDSFHNLEVHVFSRLISIAYSLGSIIALYFIVSQLVNPRAGLLSAFIYGLNPFYIFYSTTTLPEVPQIFFTLSSMAFFIHYAYSDKKISLFGFALAGSLAMLLKPIYIFIAPALLYLFFKTHKISDLKRPELYVATAIIVGPLILWRAWIQQFPEGIPAAAWLLNSTNIRFKGAFFRWLFADRMGRMILGYWGLALLGLGMSRKPTAKAGWFFYLWFIGILAYLTIFATGNVTHDYYQVFIVPILAIFAGLGVDFLLFEKDAHFHRLASICVALVSVLFMLAFGWFHIRDLFNINNPAIVAAGQRIDELVPADAKVVAPYQGDTAFLYQTNRQGWPLGFDIPDKIEKGASYYVTTTQDDEANTLLEQCELVEKTDQFIIIDLTQCDFGNPENTN